jgi:hypothetical protein
MKKKSEGRGSSGTARGDGGMINLRVTDSQTHYLMAIQGTESPANGCKGGKHGGPGGSGGGSYSWNKRNNHYHSMPSGRPGSYGCNGHVPTEPLCNGRNGSDGEFHIFVTSSKAALVHYDRRYGLQWTGAALDSDEALSETCSLETWWWQVLRKRISAQYPLPRNLSAVSC